MPKQPLLRKDSFLGIHFDFHAGHETENVGGRTTEEMIEEIVQKVRPDFIQTDCKGHPGVASYPTRVGTPARGLVRDTLRIWRDVTARHGVALYMHYSGVWDSQAVQDHPEWARVDENGQPDKDITSVFGSYADKLLIRQVKELYTEYGVDGLWIDGECWAVKPDYSDKAQRLFAQQTGITLEKLPLAPGDEYFYEYMQFNREGFRQYLRHYLKALHAECPGLQIASNWSFSSHMPEPVSAEVDFLSGDYTLSNSVNTARYETRCLCGRGMPWDLMAWGFGGNFEDGLFCSKTAVQLKQEAAYVVALGGGFQVYYYQARDGAVHLWEMDTMAEVARFCRERQGFSFKSEGLADIAVLNNGYDYYKRSRYPFAVDAPILESLKGALNIVLDGANCVDFVYPHDTFESYPLLIVPDSHYIDDNTLARLKKYAEDGGRLVVAGAHAAAYFEDVAGLAFEGGMLDKEIRFLEHGGVFSVTRANARVAKPGKGTEVFGTIHSENNAYRPGIPAATIAPWGKGQVCLVHVGFLQRYAAEPVSGLKDFFAALIDRLYPGRLVKTKTKRYIDIIPRKKDGKTYVHLINMNGKHALPHVVFDDIPPIYNIDVAVRAPRAPKSVRWMPEGAALEFAYRDGYVHTTIPQIEIHGAIEIG